MFARDRKGNKWDQEVRRRREGESDKGPDPERGRSRKENGEKGEKEWKEESGNAGSTSESGRGEG